MKKLRAKDGNLHRLEVAELMQAVLGESGATERSTRDAAFRAEPLPHALEAFAAKVRRDSARITDGDIARLRANGYSEDDIFEVTIAAALGASARALEAGLRAMERDR